MAGFGGIGDSLALTVAEDQPGGTLNMGEKHIHLGAGPGYLQASSFQIALIDCPPVRIGCQAIGCAERKGIGRIEAIWSIAVIDIGEIVWPTIEGKAILRIPLVRHLYFWLEECRHKAPSTI